MDKLIQDYKNELINDDNDGYGYPTGLKAKIIKDTENNDFSIPVKKVQEMIERVRGEYADTSDSGLHLQRVSGSLPTDSEIETEFPVDNNWAIEDRTHAIGKRQGAKWMRDKVSRL